MEWLDEKVERVPKHNTLYRLLCLLNLKRRFTYKQFYLFYQGLFRNDLGDELANKRALLNIINLYKYNNNKIPELPTEDDNV